MMCCRKSRNRTSLMPAIIIFLWFPKVFFCENGKPIDRCSYKGFPRSMEHQGMCFAPEKRSLSWYSAVDYCQASGSFLAKTTSQAVDFPFMTFLSDNQMKSCFWIGASDTATPGEWVWLDGTVMDSTIRGRDGTIYQLFNPSMDKVHGCVQLCIDSLYLTVEWLKVPCDKPALLICQYGLGEIAWSRTTSVAPWSSSTQEVTTEYTTRDPVVPRRKGITSPLSKAKRRVAQKESLSMYTGSDRLWTIRAFTITMCVRKCLENDRCTKVNFNRRSNECHGIGPSSSLGDFQPSKEWEVWVISYV